MMPLMIPGEACTMKSIAKLIVFLALCLTLALPAACAETSLRGYSAQDGYVYLTLGAYPQTAEGELRPILWRVLTVEEDRAYLCSEYILLAHRIHPDDKEYIAFGADLKQTEIWDYMNNEMLPAYFTEEERSLIVDTSEFGQLFLLSREDLNNRDIGFGTDKARKAWGTDYAFNNTDERFENLFRYSNARGAHSPYWTRTQSTSHNYGGVCTKAEGNLGYIRVVVADEGCRPACYLDLTSLTVTGGSGTMEDPYTVGTAAQ